MAEYTPRITKAQPATCDDCGRTWQPTPDDAAHLSMGITPSDDWIPLTLCLACFQRPHDVATASTPDAVGKR